MTSASRYEEIASFMSRHLLVLFMKLYRNVWSCIADVIERDHLSTEAHDFGQIGLGFPIPWHSTLF